MDTHDISFPTSFTSDKTLVSSTLPPPPDEPTELDQTNALAHALSLLPPALVIGIESDGLFTTREQREIAQSIPDSKLVIIPSNDGHDGFLLEFEAINREINDWLRSKLNEVYEGEPFAVEEQKDGEQKDSVFGEFELDVAKW